MTSQREPLGARRSEWLVRLPGCGLGRRRLVCLPHAGGGAGIFRGLGRHLPDGVELWAVRLPGRETRLAQPPMRCADEAACAIAAEIEAGSDGLPFSLYGHSLGGLLAFEVAHVLVDRGRAIPTQLIVGGARAPHLPRTARPIHLLPDQEFLQELQSLGGTPPELLASPEWVELLLPALRADFEVVETYRYRERPPLSVPLVAFGGTQDGRVPLDAVAAWRRHTSVHFACFAIEGGHFFIHDAKAAFIEALSAVLSANGTTSRSAALASAAQDAF